MGNRWLVKSAGEVACWLITSESVVGAGGNRVSPLPFNDAEVEATPVYRGTRFKRLTRSRRSYCGFPATVVAAKMKTHEY